jgi:hypothetical protein
MNGAARKTEDPDRPRRADFSTDYDFVVAVHAYNRAIECASWLAFDKAFVKALKGGSKS